METKLKLAVLLPFPVLPVVLFLTSLLSTNFGGEVESECISDANSPTAQRVVVIVVDSLRPDLVDPEVMPNLHALKTKHRFFDVETCVANFTLPCIKTLLEGRESPLGSRLHNFTGERGSLDALPATAKRCGWRVDLISDHTLGTLYGEWSDSSLNVEADGGKTLENDQDAIAAASALIAENHKRQLLILHVPGTDKAAHFKGVGTDAYYEHFREVDASLEGLLRDLNQRRDAVMILGDHGHDDTGNHTRNSVVFMMGDMAERASEGVEPQTLQQADLLYFLSYSMALALPAAYEGSYFQLIRRPEDLFAQLQTRALTRQGFEGNTFNELVTDKQSRQADRGLNSLIRTLPSVLFLLAFVVTVGLGIRRRRLRDQSAYVFAGLGMLPLLAAELGLWPVGIIMALALMVYLGRDHQHRRVGGGAVLLLAISAGLSAAGLGLNLLFWEVSTDPAMNILILFGGVAIAGAVVAFKVFRTLEPWPETTLLVGAICLPAGVYFFNSGPNFVRGLFVAGFLLILWRWGIRLVEKEGLPDVRRVDIFHMVVFCAVVVLLQLDFTASWRWQYVPTAYIEQVIPWAALPIFAFVLAYTAYFRSPRRSVWPLVAFGVVTTGYCVGFAELTGGTLAATAFCGAATVAWIRLRGRLSLRKSGNWGDFSDSVILFGFTMAAAWIVFDSFDVNHLEFGFAYDLVGPLKNEAIRFAVYFGFGALKYGLPVAIPAVVWWSLDPDGVVVALAGACTLVVLKIATLFSDIAFGIYATKARLYEIGITELVFTWYVGCVLAIAFIAAWHGAPNASDEEE